MVTGILACFGWGPQNLKAIDDKCRQAVARKNENFFDVVGSTQVKTPLSVATLTTLVVSRRDAEMKLQRPLEIRENAHVAWG